MKRKVSTAFVLVLLALAASSCGGGSRSGADTSGETPARKTVRVALVTDIGGLNDRGFNALANQGLKHAQTQ